MQDVVCTDKSSIYTITIYGGYKRNTFTPKLYNKEKGENLSINLKLFTRKPKKSKGENQPGNESAVSNETMDANHLD